MRSRFITFCTFSLTCVAIATTPTTEVNAVRRICSQPNSVGCAFDITAQIGLVCGGTCKRLCLTCQVPGCGVYPFWDTTASETDYRAGDIVRISGIIRNNLEDATRETADEIVPCITNLTVIGRVPLPKTTLVTANEVQSSQSPTCFFGVKGVVSAVFRDSTNDQWNWLILKTPTGIVRAAATEHDHPFTQLSQLVDADVRVNGSRTEFGSWRKFLGKHIVVFGESGIAVEHPAPDAFDSPPLTGSRRLHRQQTGGIVIGLGPNRIFLVSADGQFIPITPAEGTLLPDIGCRATVSGFVETAPMGFQMENALIRIDPGDRSPPLTAERVSAESMFTVEPGRTLADSRLYGKVIQLRGRIANSTEDIRNDGRIVLDCDGRSLTVEVRHLLPKLTADLTPGSIIDISGICLCQFGTDVTRSLFPTFEGFRIVPRFSDDIQVIRRPPWWTSGKLTCVILLMAILVSAILIWNRRLRILSERRGNELYRARFTSAKAKTKVEERTRLAIELHDSISQTLTGVALQIDAAIKNDGIDSGLTTKGILETARQMLVSCRQELRCCLWDLRSRTFEEKNMTEAIRRTLIPYLGTTTAAIRFNVPRESLSETITHTILRIVRELAVNAIRHGEARHLRIAGEMRDCRIRFSVRDDGKGFSASAAPTPDQGHYGLQGIRERLAEYDGTLEFAATSGRGACAIVSMRFKRGSDNE